MYVKCGAVEDAQRVFDMITTCNLAAWNAMLGGYAMHGQAKKALGHFEHMCQENVEIDMITFIALLQACSHAGLVDEGLHYFESMGLVYNVSSALDHYACVVDLLGCAGLLHEAEDLITMMPCVQDAAVRKPCLVLAEIMVMQRWENKLQEKFSNWILAVPQAMCC
jgi:pentatricopeptide repeat protein